VYTTLVGGELIMHDLYDNNLKMLYKNRFKISANLLLVIMAVLFAIIIAEPAHAQNYIYYYRLKKEFIGEIADNLLIGIIPSLVLYSDLTLGALNVLVGIVPALIANRKGRSFIKWWIYGALVFIVALIHALVVKPDIESINRKKAKEGFRKCPFCAEWIRNEAKVCRYCNREIQPPKE